MTTYIFIANANAAIEMHEGADLVQAIQTALAARGITVTATQARYPGSDSYIYRDVDPEGFWGAQMSNAMGDNEDWGWGATPAEAETMARPEIDE